MVAIRKEIDHTAIIAEHLMLSARIQLAIGNAEQTYAAIDEAMSLFEFVDLDVRAQVCLALRIKALVKFEDYSTAIGKADPLIKQLQNPSSHFRSATRLRLEVMNSRSLALYHLDDFEAAQEGAQGVLRVAKSLQHWQEAYDACKLLAWTSVQIGTESQRDAYYRECLEIAEKGGSDQKIDDRQIRLFVARAHVDNEQPLFALSMLESVEFEKWHWATADEREFYLASKMMALFGAQDFKAAETLCKEMIGPDFVEVEPGLQMVRGYQYLSKIYEATKRPRLAKENGLKALSFAIKIGAGEIAEELSTRWLG
jgi:hypothetical protein